MIESAPFECQSNRPEPRRSLSGAGANVRRITRCATSLVPTSVAPSWLRYSTAPNQNVPGASGPPLAPATCCRSNGGGPPGALSYGAGKDSQRLARAKSDAEPRSWSVPDLVTTLIAAPADLPVSAL